MSSEFQSANKWNSSYKYVTEKQRIEFLEDK